MTRAFFKRTEVKAEANFVLLTRRTLQLDEITNECQKQFTPLAGSIPIVGCDYVCSSFTANYRRELELERSGSIKNEQSSVKDEDFYHPVHFDLCWRFFSAIPQLVLVLISNFSLSSDDSFSTHQCDCQSRRNHESPSSSARLQVNSLPIQRRIDKRKRTWELPVDTRTTWSPSKQIHNRSSDSQATSSRRYLPMVCKILQRKQRRHKLLECHGCPRQESGKYRAEA